MTGFWPLLEKEVRVEARSRELLTGSLLLALTVLVLAGIAWGALPHSPTLAAGVLWLALLFASTLSVARSIHRERDRGTWELLALLPVDRGVVFFAKATANFLVLVLVGAVLLPLYGLLFGASMLPVAGRLVPVLVLGAVGLAAVGTLAAGASGHGRAREVLTPVLLLPLLVPLLMTVVSATDLVLSGAPIEAIARPLQILVAFDTIYLAIGWVAFDHLLGD